MDISQELMREHQLILKVLARMRQFVARTGEIECESYWQISREFVSFVEQFADDYHHSKEEDILFSALNEPGVLAHCNPVEQMLYEHDMARKALATTRAGIEQVDADVLEQGVLEYCNILEQHIFKEDNILYPMAERSLNESQKAAIDAQYQSVEAAKDKNALWDKYLQLLEKLDTFTVSISQ